MSRLLVVLRPEPGNAATRARAEAIGWRTIALPLFAVRPLPWSVPEPDGFDALLLTSANAVRHAGTGLAALASLPVCAVGAATTEAARGAGLDVRLAGTRGAAALLAEAQAIGIVRALHLAGREAMPPGPPIARRIAVYASEPLPANPEIVPMLAGSVVLLHSPRAARYLAALTEAAEIDRATVRLAALSAAIAAAAGDGWDQVAVAAVPNDATLLAAAATLAD